MASDNGVKFYLRFVTQKHKELSSSINELVGALVSENLESKKQRAKVALNKAQDLKSAIPDQDIPDWLLPVIRALTRFSKGSDTQQDLIGFIINNESSIRNHKWVQDNSSEHAFNFDSIFEHYKAESRLPELFDEIIRVLEEIESSGEIDSITMLNALTKVIATLKKNKDGSFFSMNSAWSFVTSFLKHYFLAEISQIPVLGSALQALEKAVKETNQELSSIKSNVEQEMKETVEREIRPLVSRTQFAFLEYDANANEIARSDIKTISESA